MEEIRSALWIRCPFCNSKTDTKVYPETILLNFPMFCPKCQREAKINVVKLKMVMSDESDA